MITYERTPEGTLRVHTVLEVGIEDHVVTLDLGAWPIDAPDPAGVLGLASSPVVVLSDARLTDLAIAGAVRSGQAPACVRLRADDPRLGIEMLVAVSQGADVIVIESGGGPQLALARALGGRPLAVLPLGRPDDIARYLAGCLYDVHVPLPTGADALRDGVHAAISTLDLESRHHLVEVDPAPAFAQTETTLAEAPLDAIAAAAAGVLAGRLAVGNRHWRAEAGV